MTAPATIVLVPGLMNDGAVWRDQVGPLSRLAPVHIASNDGLDTLQAMAERILASTAGPLLVAGHSMGGRVALEAVIRAPERMRALAMLNSGAHPRGPDEEDARMRLVAIAHEQGMAAVADEWLPPMVAPTTRAATIDTIRAMLRRATPDSFEAQQRALLDRSDRSGALADITCPTLIATGDQDAWSPPDQQRAIADAIPGAELAIIEGSGHMLPMEQPEATTALLMKFFSAALD